MNTHTPLFLLAALGLLTISMPADAAPDTSQWACSTCPYPKGTTGSIDAGLGSVSDKSARYGDFSGLNKSGAHLILGGTLTHRGDGGFWADLSADELGLDTRAINAQGGVEGTFVARFGYAGVPRHFADGARSPFGDVGGSVLRLPAGYPASGTNTMPLATTLQSVEPGFDWRRLDLGASFVGMPGWTFGLNFRRDVRDGTRPLSVSFFSTAAQLAAPVDHQTDQFELSASFRSGPLTASLAYVVSQFRNGADALRWDNPFLPVTAGATVGQLALAPDNEHQQLVGSAAYVLTPWLRASGDFAVGRLTQNQAFLPSTITAGVAAGVPALPAPSLDGRVDTFNGSLRLTATPLPGLRLAAAYARNARENDTGIAAYPQVATDIFYSGLRRSNTPLSFWHDKFKLEADWRGGPMKLRLAGGAEQDNRERSYHEVVETKETTLWLRASVQPVDALGLSLKFASSDRSHSTYGVATWFGAVENPLLRKYNLAERRRDRAELRADITLAENLSLGLSAETSDDEYAGSLIGLTDARSSSGGLDLAYAFSEHTRLTLFAHGERIRSTQAGSALIGAPDWQARTNDRFEVFGIGLRHAAIPDKLDIGADLTSSRARSAIEVVTVMGEPPFPLDRVQVDSVRLFATYKLDEKLSVSGSYAYEDYRSRDWRLDGIAPDSVQSLLVLGNQAPQYRLHAVKVSLRYRF